MKIDIEERVKMGRELFLGGMNCAQSVAGAFADIHGIPQDLCMRMAASFGGGMGRMRLTCGAVSGMFIMASLENGTLDPHDTIGKTANYALVQELSDKFKEENKSITCSELLKLRAQATHSPAPDARTPEYYAKRPCTYMVESACRIYATHLSNIEEK